MQRPVQKMRALLGETRAVKLASLSDPLSARIAEHAGFEGGVLLSSGAAMAILGAPDISLLSLTEMVEQTRRVARATTFPILVDGEQGFGNALNAMRTVEEIEASGAAAVTIEDTVLPRAYMAGAALQLVSEQEGIAKIKAALLGRQNPEFVVLARTSALYVVPLDEALRRIRNYEEAGVDGIFLSGVQSLQQLEAARAAVTVPIVVGAVAPELRSVDLLRKHGVSAWAQGNLPIFDAAHAMQRAYTDILESKRQAPMQGTATDAVLNQMTRGSVYDKWLDDYC